MLVTLSGRFKGGKRHFTNFEAMEEQKKKEEKERQWRVSICVYSLIILTLWGYESHRSLGRSMDIIMKHKFSCIQNWSHIIRLVR